jgi:hypothetical protein
MTELVNHQSIRSRELAGYIATHTREVGTKFQYASGVDLVSRHVLERISGRDGMGNLKEIVRRYLSNPIHHPTLFGREVRVHNGYLRRALIANLEANLV